MNPIDLWGLLPSAYQIDDAARGYPLRALLNIIAQQANVVQDNIADLWDDYFIETCADWVIPYIGDLIGSIPIYPVLRGPRADVARTIYFRRRKGTLPMLEELARYVTGWSVHAVAFFDIMTWTQNMNHLRDQSVSFQVAAIPPVLGRGELSRPVVGTVDVRDIDALDRIQTGFDTFSHSADVRPMTRTEGWHNIPNIGFFIWRLGSYRLEGVNARRSTAHPHGYHFSPLGNPAPIFNMAERETDDTGLATEIHVNSPIRPTAFYFRKTDYYPASGTAGTPEGISIFADNVRIEPEAVECMNLRDWDRPNKPGIRVGVDVALGRFTFAAGKEPVRPDSVRAYYSYGFSADLGGGSYRREHLQVRRLELPTPLPVGTGIGTALANWAATPLDPVEVIISSSRTFVENVTINQPPPPVDVERPELALTLLAADRQRPLIRGNVIIGANAPAQVTLDGLVIEGHVEVSANSPVKRLTLKHCTLVPGRALDEDGEPLHADQPSLLVRDGNDDLEIEIEYCITGWLQIPEAVNTLTVRDSIIDSPDTRPALAGNVNGKQPAPRTTLERVTIFGAVHVRELTLASEVIFNAPVISQRRQTGCVRFSYVADGSETPRRYQCQPDTALEGIVSKAQRQRIQDRLTPVFTARRYGSPAYAQLALITAAEIREGAENGAEMGVFNLLMQPQREANLRTRLDEYLPFGLEPGFIYVT